MNSESHSQIQTEPPSPQRDLFYPPHPMPLPVSSQDPATSIRLHEVTGHATDDPMPCYTGPAPETVHIIRLYFSACEYRDRATLDHLLSTDFSFSSPLNHRMDRESYFRECWPMNPDHTIHIERIFEKGNEAFVTYECERADGTRFRNTGFFILREGIIRHIHIYCDSPEDIAPLRQPSAGIVAAALT